jgi:hypothetical protein
VRERLGRTPDAENESDNLTLADAQLLVARLQGFASWAGLAKHIGGITLAHWLLLKQHVFRSTQDHSMITAITGESHGSEI